MCILKYTRNDGLLASYYIVVYHLKCRIESRNPGQIPWLDDTTDINKQCYVAIHNYVMIVHLVRDSRVK